MAWVFVWVFVWDVEDPAKMRLLWFWWLKMVLVLLFLELHLLSCFLAGAVLVEEREECRCRRNKKPWSNKHGNACAEPVDLKAG